MENKSRMLYTYKFLNENTDENNRATLNQIVNRLRLVGINTHKNTVLKDIRLLEEFGVDIIKVRSSSNEYFVGSREFEVPEIKMLADAVWTSRFISQRKSKDLLDKLLSLVSVNQANNLRKSLDLSRCIKSNNEQLFYTIDFINDAIEMNRKIEFRYFNYAPNKEKIFKHSGFRYIVSPYALHWNNDHYYVIGYSEKHNKIAHFRVDRMERPNVLEEQALCQDNFSKCDYVRDVFSMYTGKLTIVEFDCTNDLMDIIIDQFGEDVDVAIIDKGHFKATVKAALSPTFYAWIFQFAGRMKVISPNEINIRIKEMSSKLF